MLGVDDDEDADFSVADYVNKKSVSGDRRLGKKNAKRNDFRLQEPQSAQNKYSGSHKVKDKKGRERGSTKLKEEKRERSLTLKCLTRLSYIKVTTSVTHAS